MNHFFYLTDLGKTQLPTKLEIRRIMDEKGEQVFLLLDSCVCLDILNFLNHKQLARVDKFKIFNLIEFIQKNDVQWTPIFALTELCYDRLTFEIIDDKLWDIKNKLDFIFQFPLKLLKRFDFDYAVNYQVLHKQEPFKNSIKSLTDNLNIYYAALLKIREIASNNLSKQFAEKNIQDFVRWMEIELDMILGLEYSLALEIFGGNTKLRSMIKLGSSREKALKALWGTSWDLFHARASCNRSQLAIMSGQKVHPIFITKDSSLYELMKPHIKYLIRYNSTKLSIATENQYPPHYSVSFINSLNERMLYLGTERVAKKRENNPNKINSIIRKLEENLT